MDCSIFVKNGGFHELAAGRSIGARRLWRGERLTTRKVRLRITQSAAAPAISELSPYRQPDDAAPRRP